MTPGSYAHAQDPRFGEKTWGDVVLLIDRADKGSTKERFQKLLRSKPVRNLMNRPHAATSSSDFLEAFAHQKVGVSTNL